MIPHHKKLHHPIAHKIRAINNQSGQESSLFSTCWLDFSSHLRSDKCFNSTFCDDKKTIHRYQTTYTSMCNMIGQMKCFLLLTGVVGVVGFQNQHIGASPNQRLQQQANFFVLPQKNNVATSLPLSVPFSSSIRSTSIKNNRRLRMSDAAAADEQPKKGFFGKVRFNSYLKKWIFMSFVTLVFFRFHCPYTWLTCAKKIAPKILFFF